ncbi:MAG: ferritin family protein [Desulfobacterium sp.]
MTFKSVDEILEYAIDREKEAVAFYTDLSTKDTFASVKETFVRFAKEEEKHVELLQGISTDTAKVESYKLAKVPDLKISDYLVETEYKEGMFMQDILRIAMKKEEMAVKLYQDLSEKADNANFCKLFDLLAQEESKHKLALETMYDDFLADNEN